MKPARLLARTLLPLTLAALPVCAAHAQTSYRYDTQQTLKRSTDGGMSWQTIDSDGKRAVYFVYDLANPSAICQRKYHVDFAYIVDELNCSSDAGSTWIATDLPAQANPVAPLHGNRLDYEPSSQTWTLTAYDEVYRLKKGSGSKLQIEKIADLPLPTACGALPEGLYCANQALANYSTIWYDPEQSGQGITLIAKDGYYWGYFTSYDEDGKSAWWLFQSPGYQLNDINMPMLSFTGPALGSPWNNAQVNSTEQFFATIKFRGPHSLEFTYTTPEPYKTVRLNLVPF